MTARGEEATIRELKGGSDFRIRIFDLRMNVRWTERMGTRVDVEGVN